MSLLDLPDELLEHCLAHADTAGLRAARLTSKRLLPAATKYLFAHVVLRPSEASGNKARAIIASQALTPLVRSILFVTSDDPLITAQNRAYPFNEDDKDCELPEAYEEVVHDVGRFPNLRRVQLDYAREVAALRRERFGLEQEVAQSLGWRDRVLRMLIESLNDKDHPAKRVRNLSIKNLQDIVVRSTMRCDDFKAVMSRLDTLELQIATEEDDTAPEMSIQIEDAHTFFGRELKQYWLRPVQDQLTHLKLYAGETHWGYLPFFEPRGMVFPELKSLTLGNYSFTHDWQLDWILGHAATLRSLVLDDCPIVHACRLFTPFGPDRTPPTHADLSSPTRRGPPRSEWTYEARWHDYFQGIERELTGLRHFACGHGDWIEDRAFDGSASLQAHLAPQRYCIMDGGTGPSPCVVASEVVAAEAPFETRFQYQCSWGRRDGGPSYPDCGKEDQEALDALMRSVRGRS